MLPIGRFAPSPTGLLHFGSLVAAVASYLAARSAGGRWLLRIEDLDKPREQAGASAGIIRVLGEFGFCWDGDVLYQSQRHQAYQDALDTLTNNTYACTCSRKVLQREGIPGKYGMIYPGTCRHRHEHPPNTPYAIRLRTNDTPLAFYDLVQGNYQQHLRSEVGDFVIRRADGLFAYQLAVVVDDAYQRINQVVRGADLLDNTPRQLWLQQLLGFPHPCYAHIPVVLGKDGQKLSKQNLAPAITTENRLQHLVAALRFLGQNCPDANAFPTLDSLWDWAIQHWDMGKIPRQVALPYPPQV